MRILYIGDIMASPGIDVIRRVVPELRRTQNIDLVIAQGENVSDGKGMTVADMHTLQQYGIDFFTGGNHTFRRNELFSFLEDAKAPVIGPANMKEGPGRGWKYVQTPLGRVLVISMLGQIVGNSQPVIDNPLLAIDDILSQNKGMERVATIVNIHGDFSSEKVVFGYYLDGRVTAVIGDHWHTPTADAMVQPKGTAHITDVGMCGVLHASLGVRLDSVIPRWRDGIQTKNEIEIAGPLQFNGVLITTSSSGLAESIEYIRKVL